MNPIHGNKRSVAHGPDPNPGDLKSSTTPRARMREKRRGNPMGSPYPRPRITVRPESVEDVER